MKDRGEIAKTSSICHEGEKMTCKKRLEVHINTSVISHFCQGAILIFMESFS